MSWNDRSIAPRKRTEFNIRLFTRPPSRERKKARCCVCAYKVEPEGGDRNPIREEKHTAHRHHAVPVHLRAYSSVPVERFRCCGKEVRERRKA